MGRVQRVEMIESNLAPSIDSVRERAERERTKPRLLIVDDDELVLAALQSLFRFESGYELELETKPAKAAQLLSSKRFDVVISDLLMPEMDGIQLLETAAKLQPEATRILLTAYGDGRRIRKDSRSISRWLGVVVGGHPPRVAACVDETGLALVVRFVLGCRDALRATLHGSIVNGIDVLDVDVDRPHPGRDMRRQVTGLNPNEGVTNLQERGTVLVALELDRLEGPLQNLRQVSRTMQVRPYDTETFVYVLQRATHDPGL
jgi:CheY-like chemotaxis protein